MNKYHLSWFVNFVAGIVLGSVITGYVMYEEKPPLSKRLSPYFALLDQYPEVLGPEGNASEGEIQIIRDPTIIATIESDTKQKVGILATNRWQSWVVDPVQFPSGAYGVYGRFFWNQALKGPAGAAVLPILPDGRYLLISIYRHPLRKWVLEIPRGNGEGAEFLRALIARELKEETGAEIAKTEILGHINPDSGITLGGIPLAKVTISKMGNPDRDDAEASIHLHPFSKEELERAILAGYATINIDGKKKNIEIGTDSFLLASLYLEYLKEKYTQRP